MLKQMLNFVNVNTGFLRRYFCLNDSLYYFSLKTSENYLKMNYDAFYSAL